MDDSTGQDPTEQGELARLAEAMERTAVASERTVVLLEAATDMARRLALAAIIGAALLAYVLWSIWAG